MNGKRIGINMCTGLGLGLLCTEQGQPAVMLCLVEAAHLESSVLYVYIKWVIILNCFCKVTLQIVGNSAELQSIYKITIK